MGSTSSMAKMALWTSPISLRKTNRGGRLHYNISISPKSSASWWTGCSEEGCHLTRFPGGRTGWSRFSWHLHPQVFKIRLYTRYIHHIMHIFFLTFSHGENAQTGNWNNQVYFPDMREEQDALIADAYPKLRQYCRQRYAVDFQVRNQLQMWWQDLSNNSKFESIIIYQP